MSDMALRGPSVYGLIHLVFTVLPVEAYLESEPH